MALQLAQLLHERCESISNFSERARQVVLANSKRREEEEAIKKDALKDRRLRNGVKFLDDSSRDRDYLSMSVFPTFIEFISALAFYAFGIPFNGFDFPTWVREYSWASWMIWALILFRFIGIKHPPVLIEEPLDKNRMIIGWISIAVFILCFTPVPFSQIP
jgi:hypothetical protein